MPDPKKHPEGLPFEPEGAGFTQPDTIRDSGAFRRFLLSDHNVASIKHNHESEFSAALFALQQIAPTQQDRRTGITRAGFDARELERIAALSVFVTVGVVQ